MTHTLETTGIARVVARALRLNEDLTEAIGLGHDMGHTPFGHAGRGARSTRCLRERFGTGFRHNEQSLRIAEQLNLTARGARRDPHAHRRRRSPRRSRARSSGSSTASPTSTTTSTTRSARGCSRRDDLPRDEIELLGETGSSADRHARARPDRELRARRRHRPERGGRRGDARAPRSSCSSASTSGRARAQRARAGARRSSADLRPPRRARRLAGRDPSSSSPA